MNTIPETSSIKDGRKIPNQTQRSVTVHGRPWAFQFSLRGSKKTWYLLPDPRDWRFHHHQDIYRQQVQAFAAEGLLMDQATQIGDPHRRLMKYQLGTKLALHFPILNFSKLRQLFLPRVLLILHLHVQHRVQDLLLLQNPLLFLHQLQVHLTTPTD